MPWIPLHLPDDEETDAVIREHRGKAKFLVDENVGSAITQMLRDLDWNATDVFELGLQGHPDENIFAAARKHDRILLTHDADFLDDRRFSPRLNPGLVILPGGQGDSRALVFAIDRVLEIVGGLRELWRSTKIVISPDGTWTALTFDQDEGRVSKTRYRFLKHKLEVWEDDEP